jgi:hypothetical protein
MRARSTRFLRRRKGTTSGSLPARS